MSALLADADVCEQQGEDQPNMRLVTVRLIQPKKEILLELYIEHRKHEKIPNHELVNKIVDKFKAHARVWEKTKQSSNAVMFKTF